MNFFERFTLGVRRLFFQSSAPKQDFGVETAVTRTMENNINLWYLMYINQPPWSKDGVTSTGLPAAIVRELARYALVEFEGTVSGSVRGDFLNECLQDMIPDFDSWMEQGLAYGSVALQPFVYNDSIRVAVSGPNAFQPTKFDVAGKCIAGTFRQLLKSAGKWYIRLEHHEYTPETGHYVIENKAHESNENGTIGRAIDLTEIPEWANIEPILETDGMEGTMFAYFQNPKSNTVEPGSHSGMSVYGGEVVDLIKQADEQWEAIWWEYKSGERKILVEDSANARKAIHNRLFSTVPLFSKDSDFFHEFSPAFRNDALYQGFQYILKQIEYRTGLARGAISDPDSVERTATDVLRSKYNQFVTEKSIQRAWGRTLNDILYAMDVLASHNGLAPEGAYKLDLNFGDGVLEDPDGTRADKAQALSEVAAGIRNPWEYRRDFYGETEEEAKANLPGLDVLVDEPPATVE